jgi:hypothetical protein
LFDVGTLHLRTYVLHIAAPRSCRNSSNPTNYDHDHNRQPSLTSSIVYLILPHRSTQKSRKLSVYPKPISNDELAKPNHCRITLHLLTTTTKLSFTVSCPQKASGATFSSHDHITNRPGSRGLTSKDARNIKNTHRPIFKVASIVVSSKRRTSVELILSGTWSIMADMRRSSRAIYSAKGSRHHSTA